MKREEFKKWLQIKLKNKKTIDNRLSNAAKVDKVYDLDQEYAKDSCETLLSALEYSKDDYLSGVAPQCGIIIKGNYYTGLSTLRQAVRLYVEFLDSTVFGQNIINSFKASATIPSSKTLFIGSFKNFIAYVGGFTKNKIATLTKACKKKLSYQCEYCGKIVKQLDAAHIEGSDRQTIILDILNKYYQDPNNNDNYIVDLEEFGEKYVDAHLPLRDHFYFLCKSCHKLYDATPQKLTDIEIKKKIKPLP